jgi:ATP-dependent RNA helicase DHX57
VQQCYKLISQVTYDKLPDHGTPEIHRCALDQTLLSLMFLGMEQGSGNFLRTLLDPPSQKSMDSAILSLQKLGAISPNRTDGSISLTPLGMHLAGIPAPPTVGKILVMGSILGCRSAALAMAAGMSVGRSPFLRIDNRFNRNQEEESMQDMIRRKVLEERAELFKSVGNSDHAFLAAAYLKWDSCKQGDRRRCCDQLGLAFSGMNDMQQLVRQLDSSLSAAGYYGSQEADRNSNSWRIIRSCVVAALAPSQVVRVQKPSTKYHETAEGAVEKDGEARELKFFIQAGVSNDDSGSSQSQDGAPSVHRHFNPNVAEERVFFHPSSANFSTGNFACPWLVYHELVRTSKPFLRDATECSAYALLLFGGNLEVQAGKGLIVIEDWARLSANARIGALIGGLRKKIDELLQKKVEEPRFDIAGTVEMKLIRSLLVTDGLG